MLMAALTRGHLNHFFSASHHEDLAKANFHQKDMTLDQFLGTLWFTRSEVTPNALLAALKNPHSELRQAMTTFPVRQDYPETFKKDIADTLPEWQKSRAALVEKLAGELEQRVRQLGHSAGEKPLEETFAAFKLAGTRTAAKAPTPPASAEPLPGAAPKKTVSDYMLDPSRPQSEFAMLRNYVTYVQTTYGEETAQQWLNRTDIDRAVGLARKWQAEQSPAKAPPTPAALPPNEFQASVSVQIAQAPAAEHSLPPATAGAQAATQNAKVTPPPASVDPSVAEMMGKVAHTEKNIKATLRALQQSNERLTGSEQRLGHLAQELEGIEIPHVAIKKQLGTPKREH
jgi:hypothetical protein